MKIAVAAMGESLDAEVSGQFARCPYFVIVDSQTQQCEAFSNPAASAAGGAGPAAVRELAGRGVTVALAGRVGPNAERALEAAGIKFVPASGRAADAVEQCLRGEGPT
jgi:predicted Fe-Mo cluster-binding NifX family protein